MALQPSASGQQLCQPQNTGYAHTLPSPATLNANCLPGGSPYAGPAPQVIRLWPEEPGDLPYPDVLSSGLPFYVEIQDKDWYIQRCTWGDKRDSLIETNDNIRYRFHFTAGTLPEGGGFDTSSGIAPQTLRPAAVFLPPPGLPHGAYQFSVTCSFQDDAGAGKALDLSQESSITWNLTLTVSPNCTATVAFEEPQKPAWNPPPPPTGLETGLCCLPQPGWEPGMDIKPVEIVIPTTVRPGRYYVFQGLHDDLDYLRRRCDDVGNSPICQTPGGINLDTIPASDACTYSWSSSPGLIIVPGAESSVIVYAPAAGTHQVCLMVGNRPGQHVDSPTIAALFPMTVVAADLHILGGVQQSSGLTTVSNCAPIRWYVNGDDDDRDGVRDSSDANGVAQEDDLYTLAVHYPSQQGALPVYVRVTASAPTIGVYADPTMNAPAGPGWRTLIQGAVADFYLSAAASSSTAGDYRVFLDVSLQAQPGQGQWARTELVATVFGIAHIEFLSSDGKATVRRWNQQADGSTMPRMERPTAFGDDEALAQSSLHFDPGGDPALDTPWPTMPPGGSSPEPWSHTKRHVVLGRVQIVPPVAGVEVQVGYVDVDDNSYPIYGGPGEPRASFLDPHDYWSGPADALARYDNTSGGSLIGVAAVDASPPQDTLSLETDSLGIIKLDFHGAFSPGDNWRLFATFDKALALSQGSRLLAMVPGDYAQQQDHERDAALLFVRTSNQDLHLPQCRLVPPALPVANAGAQPLGAGQAQHTLASATLTVRRRLHVEMLAPGAIASQIDLSCDPIQENRSPAFTRFVTGVTRTGLGNADLLVTLGGPAGDLPIRRRAHSPMFATWDHQFWTWAGGQYTIPPVGLVMDSVPDASPAPTVFGAGWPGLNVGPLENGRVDFLNLAGAAPPAPTDRHILASSETEIYLDGAGALSVQFMVRPPGGGAFQEDPNYRFEVMVRNGNSVTITLQQALSQPLAVGSTVGIGSSGGQAPSWEGPVTGSTLTTVTVAPNTQGVSLRFPVLLYDDSGWLLRAANGYSGLLTKTVTQGQGQQESFRLIQRYYRDACVGIEPVTENAGWTFWKHNPIRPTVRRLPADNDPDPMRPADMSRLDDFWFALGIHGRGGMLQQTSLLRGLRLANDRFWCAAVLVCPDGHAYCLTSGSCNDDPLGETSTEDGSVLRSLGGLALRSHRLSLPGTGNPLFPNSFLPFVQLYPWNWRGEQSPVGPGVVDQPYPYHGYNGVTWSEMMSIRVLAHELGHLFTEWDGLNDQLGSQEWLPGAAPWSLYPVLRYDDHTIPGIMSNAEMLDPVSSPGQLVEAWSSTAPGRAECLVSPYLVRHIKKITIVPGVR